MVSYKKRIIAEQICVFFFEQNYSKREYSKGTKETKEVSKSVHLPSGRVMSANDACHFNSKVNFCRLDGLYLAHTRMSLNRIRCRSFRFPSLNSIMKLSLTSRRCALSCTCCGENERLIHLHGVFWNSWNVEAPKLHQKVAKKLAKSLLAKGIRLKREGTFAIYLPRTNSRWPRCSGRSGIAGSSGGRFAVICVPPSSGRCT